MENYGSIISICNRIEIMEVLLHKINNTKIAEIITGFVDAKR
jgi:hypothetical protein